MYPGASLSKWVAIVNEHRLELDEANVDAV
jgi:hypothetical protein